MNGKFERGEIYWVRDALTDGTEAAFKRPFVIVSNNEQNDKWGTILGASLTTKPRYGKWYVVTKSTQRTSWVMCNCVVEIDKARLMEYAGRLSPEELKQVNEALKFSLDLTDDEPDVEESGDEDLSFQREMYKKLYEKALDELVKLKLQTELSEKCDKLREKPAKNVIPKAEAQKVEAPKVAPKVSEKVNINTADAEAIAIMLDIPETTAYLITGYRRQNGNFVDIEELKDVIGLPKDFVAKYGDKIVIDEIKKKVEPTGEKVNVNTATPEEIHKKAGLPIATCNEIRAYRNKNGSFEKVEDLLNVKRFGVLCLSKYGHLLEV